MGMLSRRELGRLLGGAFCLAGCRPDSLAVRATPEPTIERARVRDRSVVVVGAGVGGLAAALTAQRYGANVTLLERASSPGGRVRSLPVPGLDVIDGGVSRPKLEDVGAQFLNDRYRTLLGLVASADPSLAPLPLSHRSATLRRREPVIVDAARPDTIYRRGLLDLRESVQVKSAYDAVVTAARGLPLDEADGWARVPEGSASAWLSKEYGAIGSRYLGEPAIETFFFHRADEASQSLFWWIIANHASARAWFTFAGHNQAMITALARAFVAEGGVLRNEAEVRAALEPTPGRVRVTLAAGDETLDADAVILATPAPATRAMLARPSAAQAAALAFPYAPTVVVNFHCAKEHAPFHRFGQVGGVHVPRAERNGGVAGFSVESGKYPDAVREATLRGHEIYGVHLASDAARPLLDRPDDAIVAAVRAELAGYFPGMLDSLIGARVTRWPDAVPIAAPGRNPALHTLWRAQANDASHVFLAGDQVSFGTMDAAARAGVRAAEHALAKLTRG